MNLKQLLSHLAAGQLAHAMSYDVSRLTNWCMLGPEPIPHQEIQRKVLGYFFRRWNCVFDATDDEVTEVYRDKAWIVAAATLHKHGFSNQKCTEHAIQAIDRLNQQVALSDYFFAHSDEAKSLLQSVPALLKRRPSVPESVTFYRTGDVVAYQLDGSYYACFVHGINHGNAAPLVEFFNIRLNRLPTVADINGAPAVGGKYNDGIRRIETYWVYGMRDNPDMANQFKLVQAGWNAPPSQSHLAPPVAGGSVIDIFRLQDEVDRIF